MKCLAPLLALAAFSSLAASCTGLGSAGPLKAREPSVVPDGWVYDYDYESNLKLYLRGRYDSALVEGAAAYVYFYNERDSHCRGTRRAFMRPEITALLQEARITMLDAERIRALEPQVTEGARPGARLPEIVVITPEGGLADTSFHPDRYLYHMQPEDLPGLIRDYPRSSYYELVRDLEKYLEVDNAP